MARQGSQYQTEIETFSRITAIWHRRVPGRRGSRSSVCDGLIYRSGATNDSRDRIGKEPRTAREWALNRIRDRSGNYVDFVYTEDVANGSYRPARVDYTGNATVGSAPYYSIRFTYENRAAGDLAGGYVGGGLVQEAFRLARIDAQHTSGTVLRSYILTYENSGPASRQPARTAAGMRRVRLPRANEFHLGAFLGRMGCRRSARASMQQRSRRRSRATPMATGSRTSYFTTLVRARGWLCMAAAPGCLVRHSTQASARTAGRAMALSGDLDGNGRRDVVVPGSGNAWQWLRQGSAAAYSYSTTGVANVAPGGSTALVDVDGDGLDISSSSGIPVPRSRGAGT